MEYGTKLIVNNIVKFAGTIIVYDLVANRGEVIVKPLSEGIKSASKGIKSASDQLKYKLGKEAIKVDED